MEQQNLKEYLKSMTIKTRTFGGYDPDDVIAKMSELVKLAQAEGDRHLMEKLSQAEATITEQEQKLSQAEATIAEQEQKLSQAAANASSLRSSLEEVQARCQTAEERVQELESQVAEAQGTGAASGTADSLFNQDSDAEKLRILLASLEDAKADILEQYTRNAAEKSEQLHQETELLERRKADIEYTIRENAKMWETTVELLLEQAQQLRSQILLLRNTDEKVC